MCQMLSHRTRHNCPHRLPGSCCEPVAGIPTFGLSRNAPIYHASICLTWPQEICLHYWYWYYWSSHVLASMTWVMTHDSSSHYTMSGASWPPSESSLLLGPALSTFTSNDWLPNQTQTRRQFHYVRMEFYNYVFFIQNHSKSSTANYILCNIYHWQFIFDRACSAPKIIMHQATPCYQTVAAFICTQNFWGYGYSILSLFTIIYRYLLLVGLPSEGHNTFRSGGATQCIYYCQGVSHWGPRATFTWHKSVLRMAEPLSLWIPGNTRYYKYLQ